MNAEVEKLWLVLPTLGAVDVQKFGQACYDEGYLQGLRDAEMEFKLQHRCRPEEEYGW